MKSGDFGENGKFGKNGGKSSGPLESGDFGENGKFGENGEFGTIGQKSPEGWQYLECGKYSKGMTKVAPWRVHLLTTY